MFVCVSYPPRVLYYLCPSRSISARIERLVIFWQTAHARFNYDPGNGHFQQWQLNVSLIIDPILLDDAVVEDFIEKNKATNTVRKTKSDLNVWYRWCAGVNESRKLEELTPSEL